MKNKFFTEEELRMDVQTINRLSIPDIDKIKLVSFYCNRWIKKAYKQSWYGLVKDQKAA